MAVIVQMAQREERIMHYGFVIPGAGPREFAELAHEVEEAG